MKLVLLLVLICLGTGIAALVRTLTIPVRKSDYKPQQGDPRAEEYAAKLSRMVQYDTTSYAFTDQRETFLIPRVSQGFGIAVSAGARETGDHRD